MPRLRGLVNGSVKKTYRHKQSKIFDSTLESIEIGERHEGRLFSEPVSRKTIPDEIVKELQEKDEKVAATAQAKGGPGGKNATLEEFGRDLTKVASNL